MPLCFIRKIERFAFTHIIADVLIIGTLVVICSYNVVKIKDDGWGEGVAPINNDTWLNMIGFAVYSYEGIGIVLPIMDCTSKPEHYPKIFIAVITTVMLLYVFFGEFCLFTYGSGLKLPLITSNLPPGDTFIDIVKVTYCFNLFITYPLAMYPVNTIIESYLY